MTNTNTVTPATVKHIAKLANIPVTDEEEKKLADGFTTTLQVVDELRKVPTDSVEPTHQVTGLTNVLRDDVVDNEAMFTQDEALQNASHKYNGYFVIDQIVEEK